MKKLMVVLTMFWPLLGQSQILVQGPGTSPKEFENYLSLNPRVQSFQKFTIEEMQNQPAQEQKLFALADLPPSDIQSGLETVEQINRKTALSSLSLQFLKDLLGRWLAVTPQSKFTKSSVTQLSCKVNFLLGENAASSECPLEQVDLKELRIRNSWADTLMVESVVYPLEDNRRLLLISSARYHFTLLSNTHKPVSFYGTYAELRAQHLTSTGLVSGTCESFQADIENMTVLNQGSVFWGPQCLRRLPEGQDSDLSERSWIQRNKAWLYPTAALLIGGGIYAMKDKKLVIDTSSFK
nr:hypothetical protein BdHM001_28890 [Bdellovibrio sp. HM001]